MKQVLQVPRVSKGIYRVEEFCSGPLQAGKCVELDTVVQGCGGI